MEIYLIRHGQCGDYHASDDPLLTETGFEQARALGEKLLATYFDAVYTSTYSRAMQTSRELVKKINGGKFDKDICLRDGLREIDQGVVGKYGWTGFEDIRAKIKNMEEDVPYPGGESGSDAFERCRPVLEEITSLDAERVAVVTHGGMIRIILAGVLGLPQSKRMALGDPIENCSIAILTYRGGVCRLKAFGL